MCKKSLLEKSLALFTQARPHLLVIQSKKIGNPLLFHFWCNTAPHAGQKIETGRWDPRGWAFQFMTHHGMLFQSLREWLNFCFSWWKVDAEKRKGMPRAEIMSDGLSDRIVRVVQPLLHVRFWMIHANWNCVSLSYILAFSHTKRRIGSQEIDRPLFALKCSSKLFPSHPAHSCTCYECAIDFEKTFFLLP